MLLITLLAVSRELLSVFIKLGFRISKLQWSNINIRDCSRADIIFLGGIAEINLFLKGVFVI